MTSSIYSNYLSVFSWRYGSSQMRQLFSLENRFRTWRKIWVALAAAQHQAGLVSKKELEDIVKKQNNIDIEKIFEIEKETRHDVVAAIREFSNRCKIGGGKIHLGATSMDIVDNTDAILTKDALDLIEIKIKNLLKEFSLKIEKYSDLTCIGFTHLQPAEPTTVGYRLAFYAQDLLLDLDYLKFLKAIYKGKGIKGAVGTGASFKTLLKETKFSSIELEKKIMKELGLEPYLITSQVSPRKLDYFILNFLSSVASSIAKFAEDLRILQSPTVGEWSEPFGKRQVGSSAMPFKKNPINSEKICSLARYVAQLSNVVWGNATLSHLERTLDDSANRRIALPEAFLATDEILITSQKILSDLVINAVRIEENLKKFAPFSATEAILAKSVKNGADRQNMHEHLRSLSMRAWDNISKGGINPLTELIYEDKLIGKYLNSEDIEECLDVSKHTGDAPDRARRIVREIKRVIE